MDLSIHIKDTSLDLSSPAVMGILNATPDSFFDGGLYTGMDRAVEHAASMVRDGAKIVDVGGYSSRPGASEVSAQEELDRVIPLIERLRGELDVFISVDTFRAGVASEAVRAGAHLVNDIAAGDDDPQMIPTVAALGVPYIYMHKQGTPQNMQQDPRYDDVGKEVLTYLLQKKEQCMAAGIDQPIADPGFGFGKTVAHNYQLLKELPSFTALEIPVLVGISRKSMINRVLGISAKDALNGTTFLHAFCLQNGANILRVHDVKEAVQAVMLWEYYRASR